MSEESMLIDKTIKKLGFLFQFSGFNFKTGSKTRKDIFRSRFIYIMNFTWLNTDVAGAMWWFIAGFFNSTNFTELTYAAPCMVYSILGDLKTLNLLVHEKNIDMLIQDLRQLEIEDKCRPHADEIDEIRQTAYKFVTRVFNALNFINSSVLVDFALHPIIFMIRKYLSTNEIEYLLPFPIQYPFNPYTTKRWPFMYMHQIWSGIVCMLFTTTSDYLFFTLCIYIQMQFRILKFRIENLIPTANSEINNNEEIKTELNLMIKWHQRLLHATSILENAYTRSTLYNFVSSSGMICLTGFNIVAITDVVVVITFVSFLFLSLLQIFFLCFFGDLLITAGMEVSDAAYNCRWYYTNNSIKKSLLIIQTRAQKPCKLTASNFSEVNLSSFMKILSTAWSYFALLQTLYGSPK